MVLWEEMASHISVLWEPWLAKVFDGGPWALSQLCISLWPWFSGGYLLSNILGSTVDAIKQPPDLHPELYQHYIFSNNV